MNDNKNIFEAMQGLEWANGVAQTAIANQQLTQQKYAASQKTYRTAIICLSIIVSIAIICGSVICFNSIKEQQYALNMQFAQMVELLQGAEKYETGENGTIINGNENYTSGGDINGVHD